MATNEDLAIAFLCLCDRQDKDDLVYYIQEATLRWENAENIERVLEAIRLPVSMIQRKIALLHTGLLHCPMKKKIYEEMANRLGNITSGMRSPLIKARVDRGGNNLSESREHIMTINLSTNESTQ